MRSPVKKCRRQIGKRAAARNARFTATCILFVSETSLADQWFNFERVSEPAQLDFDHAQRAGLGWEGAGPTLLLSPKEREKLVRAACDSRGSWTLGKCRDGSVGVPRAPLRAVALTSLMTFLF